MKIEGVPYRLWNKKMQLVHNKVGKKVFDLAMKDHASGRAVDMRFDIIDPCLRAPGEVYETISVTITD